MGTNVQLFRETERNGEERSGRKRRDTFMLLFQHEYTDIPI